MFLISTSCTTTSNAVFFFLIISCTLNNNSSFKGLTRKQASEIGMNVEMRLNEITEKPKKSRPSVNNFHSFRKNLVSNFDLSASLASDVMFYVKSHDSAGEQIEENDEFLEEEEERNEENLNNSSEETKSRYNGLFFQYILVLV